MAFSLVERLEHALGERAMTVRGDQPLHDWIDFLQVPLGFPNRVVDLGPIQ